MGFMQSRRVLTHVSLQSAQADMGRNLSPSLTLFQRQILDSSKLKESADNNFKFDYNGSCGKRRNCLLRAISPFPTVFSKDLYCRQVKTRTCLGKELNILHVKGPLPYHDSLSCLMKWILQIHNSVICCSVSWIIETH